MRLEHYPIEKLKKEITKILQKYHLSDCKVFFFGSRISGRGDERSDIDIGLEGLQPIPLSVMSNLREELENLPTLYKIDLVDFKRVDRNFAEIALRKIEKIS